MHMIDCVMLAWSKNDQIKKMTQAAIDSLHASTSEYKFNVMVIETTKEPVSYTGAQVFRPGIPFNYNAYLNFGFAKCTSDYVIIANNDLVFHPGWFEAILKENTDSASPWTDNYPVHIDKKDKIIPGFQTSVELCGWCIVIKKQVLDRIGKFDEQFDFWYQDNDYAMQLRRHGFTHKLIGTSWVTHLYSQSHKLLEPKDLVAKTRGAAAKFEAKYMRKKRPTICLTMIVKNESKIIPDMLKNVVSHIDYWCIVDTGSTDGTQQIIKDFFTENKVNGELHERPWKNFGYNRTEAFQLADGKADYMWVIDADDLLEGTPNWAALTADFYSLRIGKGYSHWRAQVFKSGLKWEYKGVLHEYAHSSLSKTHARLAGDYCIIARTAGARSADPDKYKKDAIMLEEALKTEPDNARYWFYLAQSYFDSHDFVNSKRCYMKRASMGGFAEEAFYAQWRVGLCAIKLNETDEAVMGDLLRAYEMRPTRAEPLHTLAEYLRAKKRFELGYTFAKIGAKITLPENDMLFIWRDVYEFRMLDELAVSAYWSGKVKECFDICKALLESGKCPEAYKQRVTQNMNASEKVLKGVK